MSFAPRSFTKADLNLTLITRGKELPELLWDLLHYGHRHPDEGPVREIIMQHIKKCGVDDALVGVDKIGNVICDIRTDLDKHKTMFSCHMDTVHHKSGRVWPHMSTNTGDIFKDGLVYGKEQVYETLYMVPGDKTKYDLTGLCKFFKYPKKYQYMWPGKYETDEAGRVFCTVQMSEGKSRYPEKDLYTIPDLRVYPVKGEISYEDSILGADDKIGCYILCKLLEQGVPGLYVFHVGEECGAHGSRHIVDKSPELVKGLQRCIAFDRKGYSDVIRTQGGETASKEFTDALALALNACKSIPTHSQFKGNIDGVFTDSAVYKYLIPECTNLSVGYFAMHGEQEHFDYIWLEQCFLPALLELKWDDIAVTRDHTAPPPIYTYQNNYSRGRYSRNFNDKGPNITIVHSSDSNNTNTGVAPLTSFPPAKAADDNLISWKKNRVIVDAQKLLFSKEVVAKTPLDLVPAWHPNIGVYPGASDEAMKRIIHAYIHHHKLDIKDMACLVLYQAQQVARLREEYKDLDRFVTGA